VKSLVLASSVIPLTAIQEAVKLLENAVAGDEVDDVKIISAAECPLLEYAINHSFPSTLNLSPSHKNRWITALLDQIRLPP
jgi:hypothetical protein